MLIMEGCLNGNKFDDTEGSDFNTITESDATDEKELVVDSLEVLDHVVLGPSETIDAIVVIPLLKTQRGG